MSEFEYDEYAEDPMQAAYEADPSGYITSVAAAAAQQASDLAYQQATAANAAVFNSQVALTTDAIDKEMTAKYGDEWEAHKPELAGVLARNPNLIPQDNTVIDPKVLGRSLEDAFAIARGVKADNYVNTRWQQIQGSPSGKLGL